MKDFKANVLLKVFYTIKYDSTWRKWSIVIKNVRPLNSFLKFAVSQLLYMYDWDNNVPYHPEKIILHDM